MTFPLFYSRRKLELSPVRLYTRARFIVDKNSSPLATKGTPPSSREPLIHSTVKPAVVPFRKRTPVTSPCHIDGLQRGLHLEPCPYLRLRDLATKVAF